MTERSTSDIGFEKQIWDAACVLRGNFGAAHFAHTGQPRSASEPRPPFPS